MKKYRVSIQGYNIPKRARTEKFFSEKIVDVEPEDFNQDKALALAFEALKNIPKVGRASMVVNEFEDIGGGIESVALLPMIRVSLTGGAK